MWWEKSCSLKDKYPLWGGLDLTPQFGAGESRTVRNWCSFCFTVTNFRIVTFLMLLLLPRDFPRGKIYWAYFFSSWTREAALQRSWRGPPGCSAVRVRWVQRRDVWVKNHCEIAQLTLKKLWLKRDRGTKFRNWAVGGTTYIVCFHDAGVRAWTMWLWLDWNALIWICNNGKLVCKVNPRNNTKCTWFIRGAEGVTAEAGEV